MNKQSDNTSTQPEHSMLSARHLAIHSGNTIITQPNNTSGGGDQMNQIPIRVTSVLVSDIDTCQ